MLRKFILMILLFPLKLINCFRRRFEKKIEFKDKFIISVGNISFGGSGKTPLVIELSRFLETQGFELAVLIRGYKGKMEKVGGKVKISDGAKIWGDEPILIKKNIKSPVYVGKDRIKHINNMDEPKTKILILDDGFQYFKIKKDLDIIIHDFENPSPLLRDFGFELKKGDIIFNTSDLKIEGTKNYEIIFDGIYDNNDRKIEDYHDIMFTAFCGIGTPESFKNTLIKNKIKFKNFLSFPDHYFYTLKDIEKLSSYKLPLITTEKDFVKLQKFDINNLYYLKIKVKLDDTFKKEIVKTIEKKLTL